MSKNAFWSGTNHKYSDSDNWIKKHSLSLFLLANVIWQTVVAIICYYLVWKYGWDKYASGMDSPNWVFFVFFLGIYLTSIVADTYGALLQVMATKWFFEKDSPQSKE